MSQTQISHKVEEYLLGPCLRYLELVDWFKKGCLFLVRGGTILGDVPNISTKGLLK